MQALEELGIFLSYPLDLDFAMLKAFSRCIPAFETRRHGARYKRQSAYEREESYPEKGRESDII